MTVNNSPPTKKARIFIVGLSGFLGYNLAYYLRHRYSVTGAYFSNFISIPEVHSVFLDLTKKEYLDRLVRMLRPDITIFAAGLNSSPDCSRNPKLAEALNMYLPLELAQSALQNGAKNIHLSCSQIFDGHGKFAKETDKNYTAQAFGRTKLTGESYIRAQTMENTTVRFGRVLGLSHFRRPSYFDKLRIAVAEKNVYTVREDKIYSFMSMPSFLRAMDSLLEAPFPAVHRTYHWGGYASREIDLVSKVFALLGGDSRKIVHQLDSPSEEEAEGLRLNPVRDYSLDSSLFSASFPWKQDTEAEVLTYLKQCLVPKEPPLALPPPLAGA